MNNLYFTATEIYSRILGSFPSKGAEINKIQVMRWCSELVTEYLRDPIGQILNNKIRVGYGTDKKIIDKRVPLPQNIFKLEGVFDQSLKLVIDFLYQGEYIYFSDNNLPTECYIDYYSLPVDEDGFPYIKRGYESACFAYCVYKMYEEDATRIPPRIQQWRWLQICQDKDWEIEAAARSWDGLTDNDIREIHEYLMNDAYALSLHSQNIIDNKNALGRTSNMNN